MNVVQFFKKAWEVFGWYDIVLICVFSLIAGHYLVVYQEPERFWVLMRFTYYWPAMLGSSVIAFLIILAIRLISFYFDLKVSWISDFNKRLFLQLALGTVLMAVLAFVLAGIYFSIRGQNIFETDYYHKDFWTVVLLISFLNLFYAAEYSFKVLKIHREKLFEEFGEAIAIANDVAGEMLASDVFEVENIAYVFHKQRVNWLVDFNGVKTAATDMTIARLLALLNEDDFFMLQKGFVVNRTAIIKIGKTTSRRLMVYLKTPFNMDLQVVRVGLNEVNFVVVSQRQVREFRAWYFKKV
ncbi:LytTR family transcriptional regulator DNA-binding domain-containing protein [Pedobacter sp. UBA4863]|uniref:LytTR family transcriptional regulator DNA-binding domain-containing protein n=1 Tax=Pedobacter sp. UBA4863 TaxID=1947060 RepID=UPI0025EB9772|nr:LytTR family transcriptional regulator DNA-binding domain-containing protein [Pedobacter sp. UBA4863]